MAVAQTDARKLLSDDPNLTSPEYTVERTRTQPRNAEPAQAVVTAESVVSPVDIADAEEDLL